MYSDRLYPVDKCRTNEFGQSFEPETKQEQETAIKEKGKRVKKRRKKKVPLDTKDEVVKAVSDSDSNDDDEMRVSESEETATELTKSGSASAMGDSDTEEGGALNDELETKELICDATSEEARVGSDGQALPTGTLTDKLKSD